MCIYLHTYIHIWITSNLPGVCALTVVVRASFSVNPLAVHFFAPKCMAAAAKLASARLNIVHNLLPIFVFFFFFFLK